MARFKKVHQKYHPDVLFLEPSEMVLTKETRDVTAMGQRDIRYVNGPVVTLVDGPGFAFNWQERGPLLRGQIMGADLVAVSRADLLDEDELYAVEQELAELSEGIFRLSLPRQWGVPQILAALASE
ncbi:MAG: hypothetical protein KQJ78_04635 [Deltaproteobacteria bacterium]|nr:hypothetical protein [Deltaproteobacteria bacterium]